MSVSHPGFWPSHCRRPPPFQLWELFGCISTPRPPWGAGPYPPALYRPLAGSKGVRPQGGGVRLRPRDSGSGRPFYVAAALLGWGPCLWGRGHALWGPGLWLPHLLPLPRSQLARGCVGGPGLPLLTIEQGCGLFDGLRDLLQAMLSRTLQREEEVGEAPSHAASKRPSKVPSKVGGKEWLGWSGGRGGHSGDHRKA